MKILRDLSVSYGAFIVAITVIMLSVNLGVGVLADHISSVELTPEWSPANTDIDYTAEICTVDINGKSINEIRIYQDHDGSALYTDFACEEKPGWELEFINTYPACIYVAETTNAYINAQNLCEEFNFSATSPDPENCDLEWKFETRDTVDHWRSIYDTTSVDDQSPLIIKDVLGDQMGDCPPGAGEECWIRQGPNSEINITVEERGRCGISGLDWCEISYTVDGGEKITETYEDLDGEEIFNYLLEFGEDSVHELNVTCEDIADNVVMDVETFRVDNTAPTTDKTFDGPQKIDGSVEWIDGITTINLNPVDPDPTGEGCDSGINETWYSNEVYTDDLKYCEDPEQYCNDGYLKERIGKGGHTISWDLWNGTPIEKKEESCHVLRYYSVDQLGNEEDVQYNCFFVDKSAPVLEKEHGEPNVFNETTNTTWVTPETDITFGCEDVDPHPSGDEMLYFEVYYDLEGMVTDGYCDLYDGEMIDGMCAVDVSEDEFVFNFNEGEDSYHELRYYCEDAVEKKTETRVQKYRVDSSAPEINKTMLGTEGIDWLGDCPPGAGDVCYVTDNGVGGIHVEVQDPDPTGEGCVVDQVSCEYEVNWVEEDTVVDSGTFGEEGINITFTEDSEHEVTIRCEDALGNEMVDVETFLVDSTPPVTTKTYGSPEEVEMGYRWITSDTPINLTAEDEKVGVEKLTYRITNIGDEMCPSTCKETGEGNWTELMGETVEFNIPDQSCHLIEYFSEDELGNVENVQSQCVMVDNTAPIGDKTVGEPKIACELENEEATDSCDVYESQMNCDSVGCDWQTSGCYHTSTGEYGAYGCSELMSPGTCNDVVGCDWREYACTGTPDLVEESECWWVRDHVTPITLDCVDQGPHPVEQETVRYRVMFDNESTPDLTDVYCDEFGGELTENGWCSAYVGKSPYEFTFMEDSEHELEFYCVDLLGNTEMESDVETFKVDSVAPTTSKTYEGPYYTDNTSQWIDTDSTVRLETEDGGDICAVGGSQTFYRYSTVDDKMCAEPEEYCDGEGSSFKVSSCEGWACLGDSDKDFFVTGRSDETNWDMSIWDGQPEAIGPNDEYQWINDGQPVPFSVEYNPDTGMVTFNVDGEELNWMYETDKGFEYLVILAKGNEGGDMYLTDLTVNGEHIDDLESMQTYLGHKIKMDDEFQSNGFIVEGKARMSYESKSSQEIPGFHVFALDTHELEVGSWNVYESPFAIPEESCHLIEYYSKDALGNKEDVNYQCTYVDKTAPEIEKSLGMPFFIDPECANGGNDSGACLYDFSDFEMTTSVATPGSIWTTRNDCGNISQDVNSYALGEEIYINGKNFPEGTYDWSIKGAPGGGSCDPNQIVASGQINISESGAFCVTPYTVENDDCGVYKVTVGGKSDNYHVRGEQPLPPCEGECPIWITSDTPIWLEAIDPEPHPSGVNEMMYRTSLVNDSYCYHDEGWDCENATGEGEWMTYDGEFTIDESSCHLIEAKATDNVDKEGTHKQCVFVENQAPIPEKTVGNPSTYCEGTECEEWEWKVTTMTPITLNCTDPGEHPVDHSMVHWRVWWDRDDEWSEWQSAPKGTEILLTEECLHELEFYCTDALGQESEHDIEKFKVEGSSFDIELNRKWNLISVPFVMLDSSIDEAFSDIADDVKSVWTYDSAADEWYVYTPDGDDTNDNLEVMVPGWGYWVLTENDTTLTIGGSLFSQIQTPPTKEITSGWNLVGYFGTEGLENYAGPVGNGEVAYCELYSLVDTMIGNPRWSSLVTYWEPDNPYQWKYLNNMDRMDPGAGYWLEMDVEDTYTFSTTCGIGDLT